MVIIKHARATFTVQPENAEAYREALAKLDKGKKGRKFAKSKPARREHDSSKRSYPDFYAGMTTTDYVSAYVSLNRYLFVGNRTDEILTYEHADRPAPMLDPSEPEVSECQQ